MADGWLRIRVDLTEGGGRALVPSPGRVMVVPPTVTFDQFGLAVDIALGRWDTTPTRVFTAPSEGRHAPRDPAATVPGGALVSEVMRPDRRFTYVFDADRRWVHECLVLSVLEEAQARGLANIPVPILGWGSVPDQYERVTAPDDQALPTGPGPDLRAVRAAVAEGELDALLAAIGEHDLRPVLQQVGQALLRAYRATPKSRRARLTPPLEALRTSLVERGWEGDDLLAAEIEALLSGTERRGRTLVVDFDALTSVMANAGEDPGGYLHLDTGEVIPAHVRHDPAFNGDGTLPEEEDDPWLYIDNDGQQQQWQDMADFAAAAGDRASILGVALGGQGALRRFRTTVRDLDMWGQWSTFSDERSWGRARALLHHHGIRAL